MRAEDPIRAASDALRQDERLEGWSTGSARGDFWLEYRPPDGPALIDTGFKVHVSASLRSAAEVLLRVAPALGELNVPFKHAATTDALIGLSNGHGGLEQIGKFITAYPPDAPIAERLARRLHEATAGLAGPRIAAEQQLEAGSLVHYRYGSFVEKWLQLPTGRVVPARLGEQGLEEDDRARAHEDPHRLDGFSHPPAAPATVAGGRYVRMQQLHASPKGSSWLGYDREAGDDSLVVIKEVRCYVLEAADGLDAKGRLLNEAANLKALEDSGLTPQFVDWWEDSESAFLVYRLVEGPTFSSILNALASRGIRAPESLAESWLRQLCRSVETIHRRGCVVGDIKPSNLILLDDRFHFIDLELSGPPSDAPAGSMGSTGYCAPEQTDPMAGRAYPQDIYGIGSTILTALTMVDSSRLPDPFVAAQIEAGRHPDSRLYRVIQACLESDPARRPASPAAVVRALDGRRPTRKTLGEESDFSALAEEAGEHILAAAQGDGDEAWWRSQHLALRGQIGRDLYTGSAGPALFLAELFGVTGKEPYLATALRAANWLVRHEAPVPRAVPMPGLYFGEAGPGFLYLKLFALTSDAIWLEAAEEVSRGVAAMPQHSPDLMTGTAGTGLFQLAHHAASGSAFALAEAQRLADHLLRTRETGAPLWTIPEDHDQLSGKAYLGFAHGTAGIGFFLANLALHQPDKRLADACAEIAQFLVSCAQPSLVDDSGLAWPPTPYPTPNMGAYWCHGAAGIARFLLKAHQLSGEAHVLEAAARAGRAIAHGAPWIGTTQCHGLAGNIDVLIDLWTATGGEELDWARTLGRNLAAYRQPSRGWPGDTASVFTPDLIVGQAGIGAAFLRLARPELPHILSLEAVVPKAISSRRVRVHQHRRDNNAEHEEKRSGSTLLRRSRRRFQSDGDRAAADWELCPRTGETEKHAP